MADSQNPSHKFDQLRNQAEALIRNQPAVSPSSSPDILELIHEVAIHQAELEIQNEELNNECQGDHQTH